jgi:hypothetical protein
MGTSFVEYKGFGFWTRDSYLERWLSAIIEQIRQMPVREPWQDSLMEHWRGQAQIDGGIMSIHLDEFLTDEQRRAHVLSLASDALQHCDAEGKRTGELFIELLEGRLRTTDASPIDYFDRPNRP